MKREVREQDFWQPRFVGGKPEDYEFRDDGEIARKDRWEMAIRRMASKLNLLNDREFEIADVERAVDELISAELG